MRILFFTIEYLEGAGQSANITDIANFLRKYSSRDYKLTLMTNSYTADTKYSDSFDEILINSGNYLDIVRTIRNASKDYDVIYFKNGIQYLQLMRNIKTPLVFVLHGPDPTFFTIYNKGVLTKYNSRIKTHIANFLQTPFFLKNADALVTVSPVVWSYYNNRFNIETLMIPDVFDFEVICKAPPNRVSSDGPVFLNVGDWDGFDGKKRTHEIVLTFKHYLKEHTNAKLCLVGIKTYFDKLKQFVDDLNISENVIIIGKVTAETLFGLYKGADIFVSATVSEGFYRPLIEAFSAGTPAIVRDTSSFVSEVNLAHVYHIKKSGGGELYDGSPSSFANVADHILAQRKFYSERAIEYAKKFDYHQIMPKYVELFDKLEKKKEKLVKGGKT